MKKTLIVVVAILVVAGFAWYFSTPGNGLVALNSSNNLAQVAAAPAAPTAGLVGWWKLDEGKGTAALIVPVWGIMPHCTTTPPFQQRLSLW